MAAEIEESGKAGYLNYRIELIVASVFVPFVYFVVVLSSLAKIRVIRGQSVSGFGRGPG